jgi:hypothetical protein
LLTFLPLENGGRVANSGRKVEKIGCVCSAELFYRLRGFLAKLNAAGPPQPITVAGPRYRSVPHVQNPAIVKYWTTAEVKTIYHALWLGTRLKRLTGIFQNGAQQERSQSLFFDSAAFPVADNNPRF